MKTPEPLTTKRLYELCELAKTSAPGSMVEVSREDLWALVEAAKGEPLDIPDFLRNQDNLREERAAAELFYLQDSRGLVGNDVLWWAKDGSGYTTDLSKAHIYSKAEAEAQRDMRKSDIPWPKNYIDTKARPAVDMQYINRSDALESTKEIIDKP